jgi:hypothetical protein
MAMFMGGAGYKASTVTVSQEVMKWLILNSDGNVVIQTHNFPNVADPMGATNEGRLYCTKCKAFKILHIEDINNTNILAELEWAKGHTHNSFIVQDTSAQIPNGERKLKVVF